MRAHENTHRAVSSGARLVLATALFLAAVSLHGEDTNNPSIERKEAVRIVERVYLDLLDRYPEERGLNTYVNYLVKDEKNEEWLREIIGGSDEAGKVQHEREKRMRIFVVLASVPLWLVAFAWIRSRNTKEFLFRTFAIALAVTASLIAAELILRVIDTAMESRGATVWRGLGAEGAPENNAAVELRHVIRPSRNKAVVYDFHPHMNVRFLGKRFTTDADGIRVTPGSDGSETGIRIVGLGDSVMFGWGVADDETYLAGFVRLLKEQDSTRPVTVLNAAVPGYNTVMEVARLRDNCLAWKPDLVLMHYVENDLYLPYFIQVADPNVKVTRSHLLAALSVWWKEHHRTRPFDRLARQPGSVPKEYEFMVGVDAVQGALRELKDLSVQNDFRLALVCNWTAEKHLLDVCDELDIPMLELGPVISRYSAENGITKYKGSVLTVSKKDPHYSALAHSIIASELFRFLNDRNLLFRDRLVRENAQR